MKSAIAERQQNYGSSMKDSDLLLNALRRFPRAAIGHLPTPSETMPNLVKELGLSLFVKRDDCTGIAFGGNKVRQLEYYLGAAQAESADVLLITGAVQSNFVALPRLWDGVLGWSAIFSLKSASPT